MAATINEISDLHTYVRSGTVVACRSWSETQVRTSSTGGGGHVGPHGGHVAAPTVSVTSTASEKLHLFIQQDDGAEFDIQLTNPGIGLREGHRVSLLYAHGRDASHWMIGALVNHTTRSSKTYHGRLNNMISAKTHPVAGLITLIVMLGLLPFFAYTVYLGFKGVLNLITWTLLWAAIIGVGMLVSMVTKSKDGQLKAQAVEVFNTRAAALLAEDQGAPIAG